MPIDHSLVGKSSTPQTFQVTEEAVKRAALDTQVDTVHRAEIAKVAGQLLRFNRQAHEVVPLQEWILGSS